MSTLCKFTGNMTHMGNLSADEALRLVERPRIVLTTAAGHDIVVAGLTEDECRACFDAFMERAHIVIGAGDA